MQDFNFGDIVLLKFPFSDGETFKKRPALVIADFSDDDVLVCRITSQSGKTKYDLSVSQWESIGLLLPSTIRVGKLATLDKTLIERKLGAIDELLQKDVKLLFQTITEN